MQIRTSSVRLEPIVQFLQRRVFATGGPRTSSVRLALGEMYLQRRLFASGGPAPEDEKPNNDEQDHKKARKMWIAEKPYASVICTTWCTAVDEDPTHVQNAKLEKIKFWEESGVRIQPSQLGVHHMNQAKDANHMVSYHSPLDLVRAVCDSEGWLKLYADLLEKKELPKCIRLLEPYKTESVLARHDAYDILGALTLPPELRLAIASYAGVHSIDNLVDFEFLHSHYSPIALENGVRDREDVLQRASDGNVQGLRGLLQPCTEASVLAKRKNREGRID
jgi:hypothetical protein